MKYRVGDKILVKSRKWYLENRDNSIKQWVNLPDGSIFGLARAKFCDQVMTIEDIKLDSFNTEYYLMVEDKDKMQWNDYMIECKVEEENMVWLAVDKNGRAHLFRTKPYRDGEQWICHSTKEIPFPVLPVDLYAISMWLNITVDKLKWENEPIKI